MPKDARGFLMIEGLLAAALVAVFAGAIAGVYLSVNRIESQEVGDLQARFLSHGGLEAARAVRDTDSVSFVAGTYGISTSSGAYQFSGSSDTHKEFTRVVSVVASTSDLFRVTASTTNDVSTKVFVSYLSRWREALASAVGDWSDPEEESTLNLSGNQNGWRVATEGDYAYVARTGGNPDFYVIDISDTDNPSVVGSVSLSGSIQSVAVSGDYVYLASTSNSSELIIVDVSNPALPSQAGSYNKPGNQNGRDVAIVGTTAYLVTDDSGNDEIYVINVTVPASPVLLGSDDLNNDGNDVAILGSYAYVATDGDELEVVDISVPALPSSVATLDLGGGSNGTAIEATGNTVFLGRANGNIEIIDVTTPTSPSYTTTFSEVGSSVRDLDLGNNNNYLFVASDFNSAEFVVVDVSTPSTPTGLGTFNAPSDFNGVAYSSDKDRAILVGDNNSEEITIYEPQ